MSDKELFRQKKQAQLDEWKAELDKLKARASGSSADIQLEINQKIHSLEQKIEENRGKLTALAESSEDAWESIKDGVESAWDSLKTAVNEAVDKFKK